MSNAQKTYTFLQFAGNAMRPGEPHQLTSVHADEGYTITREGPMYYVDHADFGEVLWEIPASSVRGAFMARGKK